MAGEKSETLITDELLDEIVVVLGEALPRFNAFAIEAVDGPLMLKESAVGAYLLEKSGTRADIEAPMTAATDTVDFQPTESATNAAISLNTKYFWNSASLTYAQQLAGIPGKTLVPNMVNGLREELWDEVTALLLVGTYATEYSGNTVEQAAFDIDDLQGMWAELPGTGTTNGLFTKLAYSNLLPNNLEAFPTNVEMATGFGLQGTMYPVTNFTGATAKMFGFLLYPQAIVGAWGLPADTPQVRQAVQINETTIVDEMTGAPFLLSEWVDPQTRTQWMSLGTVAGFAAGDTTALISVSHA